MKPFDRMVLVGASTMLAFQALEDALEHRDSWQFWLSATLAAIWLMSTGYQFVMLVRSK